MNVAIINTPFNLVIHGFSGTAVNKDYAGTAFKLMDKMWQTVKSNGLKNKGLNVWVYEPDDKIFAGVELEDAHTQNNLLEQKSIHLEKYAYYKHIGPYHLIKQAVENMMAALKKTGVEISPPYIEIYGHAADDESKAVTELLMCLQ